MLRISLLSLMTAVVLVVTQCSDDSAQSAKAGTNSVARSNYVGRGSEACQDWQYAYCEYILVRCDFGFTGQLEDCLKDYSSLMCDADDVAASCAEKLVNASICDVPYGCLYYDVTTPVFAEESCRDLVSALCEHRIDTCGDTATMSECKKDLQQTYRCDEAIGTYLEYEEVLADIKNLSCEAPPEDTDADAGVEDTDTGESTPIDTDTGPCTYSDCRGSVCEKPCCKEAVCDEKFFKKADISALFYAPPR